MKKSRSLGLVVAFVGLVGAAAPAAATSAPDPFQVNRLRQLLPADAILLGEQHDAPEHQRIHHLTVEALTAQRRLAALALEMAQQGQSTETLGTDANEDQVKAALQWDNAGWPWAVYGPAVMAAVRAGVPVVGANLPRARLHEVMANARYDGLLNGPALKAQQQNVRLGHCGVLPESQIAPMTRIQIARDEGMAQTVVQRAIPGKTVVLLAGGAHVDRHLGVPQHLPPGFNAKTVLLLADQAPDAINIIVNYDQVWRTNPIPLVDYCASFSATRRAASSTAGPGESTP